MKLERNRMERRSKRCIPIFYNGIPYLIFAALAAGFLLGTPQLTATSAIKQSDKLTASAVDHKKFSFFLVGYIGKTNSVLSSSFTESDFTYTGSKTWVDDGDGNWRLKFLSSGTFTPTKRVKIDLFLVGGGGGGGYGYSDYAGAGGGGGYTNTVLSVTLVANQSYTITVGSGGNPGTANVSPGTSGGSSSAFGYSASGGQPGAGGYSVPHSGGAGGSGGGSATYSALVSGSGGFNGSDGGSHGSTSGGVGQHTTTREFGEVAGTLYSGGGGGGAYSTANGSGGAGGGGAGGINATSSYGTAGTNNLGGGGGGGGAQQRAGGAGGSGIIVIRNKR